MIEKVLNVLATTTPDLRARYLLRIRGVQDPDAREVERKLMNLIEREQDPQRVA